MSTRTFGTLEFVPAADRPDLVSPAVAAVLPPTAWIAAIDATLSDTAAFCAAYDIAPSASANCVVVTGKRDGVEKFAALVVLATTRADVNGVVKRKLDVRKASFAPQEFTVEQSGMEYGGITPIGLPAEWPVWVDSAVVAAGPVIIGAGIRGAKILIDGADLAAVDGVEVVDGLARTV